MAEITSVMTEIDGVKADIVEVKRELAELGTLPLADRVVDPLCTQIANKEASRTALINRLARLEATIATPTGIECFPLSQ